ncbi:MAG: NUDIX hydrolase [Paludibacter sp.]|nr:NUDIX hydrolase [Bacteroidales bacterium]MCM1069478.1 NUDIX hydrolase [Prevotella sp.]MCM1354134.1 NUDIX hydrolase [Bacteroides sp.]MCM1443009.1 NUDIX hydrolase [Muribaculum sp.]MCM1482209.1 NUDIX hydrolase [Paludibacter sp.]
MKPLENRKWEVLESRYLAQEGDWYTVRKDHVRLPSGVEIPSWYIFEFPDWVNVIATTNEGNFVLISQYRHAIGETHYELCAGVIDPTDASPLEAAKRELLEETGFGGGEWTEFMCLSPNPTNHTNRSYTFLATGVQRIDEAHQESTEDIQTHILTPEQLKELLCNGEIVQALHAAPLWKYLALKAENEKR